MSNKTVWTDESKAEVVKAYGEVVGLPYEQRQAVVEQLAEDMGTSVASVRSVLVLANVYKKKETTQAGTKAANKEELVKAFEAVTGKELKSLSNASRKDLQELWDFIRTSSDAQDVKMGR